MARGYQSAVDKSSMRITSSVNKIKLKHLGADVKRIESKIYHATFDVEGTKLEYYYNINESGKFFLERMEPYYKNFKVFSVENDAIKAIYEDVQYFKNAAKSHNYEKFLAMSIEMGRVQEAYADMFLHHNVPQEELDEIRKCLIVVRDKVDLLNKTTKEIKLDVKIEDEVSK